MPKKKKWFYAMFEFDGETSAVIMMDWANKHGLKPGEIIVVTPYTRVPTGYHVQTAMQDIEILYWAEKELK